MDLFSGIGGITIALQEYVTPLCYCESDPYAQSVLLQRMQEKDLPKAPIWDDIRTLSIESGIPIDIIYGGFPCQDISIAGAQKGLEGERSSLVFEIFRLLDETKAPFLFLENVPNIRTKGAERICKELAERGYDSRWCMLSASDVGAHHRRERWFLLGYSKYNGLDASSKSRSPRKAISNDKERKDKTSQSKGTNSSRVLANPRCTRQGLQEKSRWTPLHPSRCNREWEIEPSVGRMVNGLSNRVDRIKALGNSVVSSQVETAFLILFFGEEYEIHTPIWIERKYISREEAEEMFPTEEWAKAIRKNLENQLEQLKKFKFLCGGIEGEDEIYK